ncbi:MAG: ATP synthase gamma chain [Microgenomates group bacterium GW2011_GWA2_46_7]|nr:MAG: ATP synthase gamma chain [Microgenomates group bacterium GW2011_GWC2_46_7]KKU45447.1 MAG: ATP synthase gamma chain [Microgenomates group bacterium GW2011_GWA2_46_7]
MGNLIGIRRRIKSAKNIAQITRAMQMVSASKMKKAQDAALATRPFTDKLREVMSHVTKAKSTRHTLTTIRPVHSILVLLVSTNKGMCGGLNVNLYRGLLDFASDHPGINLSLATIGKKAKYFVPGRETELAAKFNDLSETPSFAETRVVTKYALDSFVSGKYDQVYLAYPKFISTLQNDITFAPLLPIQSDNDSAASTPVDYTIEPGESTLLGSLLPYQVEMSVYQTILESRASEHSARMVAMKSASDNAKELIGNFTLDYNQARQSQVTSELLDVTTARMAIV